MLKVVIVGLGSIGLGCAQSVRVERDMRLVGMVDTDPTKVGKTLPDIAADFQQRAQTETAGSYTEPVITTDIAEAVKDGADVAVVTAVSDFPSIIPIVEQLLDHKVAVVTSCEEMIWPWYRYDAQARALDDYAKSAGRAVLGAGVNPGFAMDYLPIVLATVLRRVRGVQSVRRVEAGTRRAMLQKKIGATLTPARFASLAPTGQIGHKGIEESLAFVAAGLGQRVEPGSIDVTLEPVLADKPTPSALGLIQPGYVRGIHNVGLWKSDKLTISLDLTMAVNLDDPKDVVILDGPVPLRLKVPGGIPGDSATVASLLNHVRVVHAAHPGLRTLLDVPVAGCRGASATMPAKQPN